MKSFASALLVCILCHAASAAELIVWRLDAGLYAVQDGQIVRVREVTPDSPPVPPQPPAPSKLTDRAKAIKAAADKVPTTADPQRESNAQQLALLYREIAKKITEGKIQGQELAAFAVKYGSDSLLAGVKAVWQPVRDVFSEQWAAVVQEGGDDAAYVKLLNEAADGLNASAPKKELDPEKLKRIMEIVLMILELIAKFS